jgi:hypothetical protein
VIRLHINESLEQLEPDMFVTDYVGDIVNLLVNKPKQYRILWDFSTDVYAIGDANTYIHRDLLYAIKDAGYAQTYNNNKSCIFIPYAQMESDWEVEDRTERTYITTGIIITNGDFSKLFPDFYNKLKGTQNLITKDSKKLKDLIIGYQKQLEELQKEEKQLLSIFRNSDIEMKKDYKGYGNLKNYLMLRKHRMNRINDDLPALCLDDIFILPKTNKISFWRAYDTDINGYNLYNLKNDLYDNLHRQGTMYEEMIKFLDDLGLPYEYVFNYV